MKMLIRSFFVITFLALMAPPISHAEDVAELVGEGPEGYKQSNYRTPVPATLKGARVVDAKSAHELWQEGSTVFVDVLPRPPQPKNIKDPTKWKVPKRFSIKGSTWLPNVGFGRLHPKIDAYYRNGLERLTKGDKTKSLVIFCQAQCWMSWNAAKRALSYGYTTVAWFPGGSNDWDAVGYPLEEKLPAK